MTEGNHDVPPLSFLKEIAMEAGIVMRAYFPEPGRMKPDMKPDNTPVTEVDRRISELVRGYVSKKYPYIGILCEEGGYGERKRIEFIVDPLDGTAGFARGDASAVFAVAVAVDGEIVHSVIYNPLTCTKPRMFSASKDVGAFINNHRMSVSQVLGTSVRPSVGIATWPNCRVGGILKIADELQRREICIVGVTSISLTSALVAAGSLVGVIMPGQHLHDAAPGDLLVQEAGGMTTDLRGNPLRYDGEEVDGFVFSNGRFHNFFLEVVQKHYP